MEYGVQWVSAQAPKKTLGPPRHQPFFQEPILLLRIEPSFAPCSSKALERAGYTVDEAADGNAAIEKVRSRRYLLVLSDLKLPGHSGIEVLREAKRVELTLPVILLTAYGSVEEAVTAMKDGAFDFDTETRRPGSSESVARPRRQATGIASRESASAQRAPVRRAVRLSADRR